MKRILVVDDSAIARDIVARVLRADYELLMSDSGADAVKKALTLKPDLILLDLLMQGMDGFAVLKALREAGCEIKVLVVSADIQKSTKANVLALGAAGLVNKPIVADVLKGKILEILQADGLE